MKCHQILASCGLLPSRSNEWGRRFQQCSWNVIYGNGGFWLAGAAEWSSHGWMTWFLSVWPTLLDLWTWNVSDVSCWRDGHHNIDCTSNTSDSRGQCVQVDAGLLIFISRSRKRLCWGFFFFFVALNVGETSIPAMPRKRSKNVQGI